MDNRRELDENEKRLYENALERSVKERAVFGGHRECLEFDLKTGIDAKAAIMKMNAERELRMVNKQLEDLSVIIDDAEDKLTYGVRVKEKEENEDEKV